MSQPSVVSLLPGEPPAAPPRSEQEVAEATLRHILNSRARWNERYHELDEIRKAFPALDHVFYDCASKLLAKSIKKKVKAQGVTGRYYAVHFDAVVGVARNRKALLDDLATLSFAGRVEDCAIFKV